MPLRADTNRMLNQVARTVVRAKIQGCNPIDALAEERQITRLHARQLIHRAKRAGFDLVPAQRRSTDET